VWRALHPAQRQSSALEQLRQPSIGGVSTLATLSFFGWMHSQCSNAIRDDAVSKKEKPVLTAQVTSVTPVETVSLACCSRGSGELRVPQAPPKLPSGQVLLTARACPHHVRRKAKRHGAKLRDYCASPSPPAEKATARQDQTGQTSTRMGRVLCTSAGASPATPVPILPCTSALYRSLCSARLVRIDRPFPAPPG
jgi:hypothetical protein